MSEHVECGGLRIAKCLFDLVNDEIAPNAGTTTEAFWNALAAIVDDLGPKNQVLLERRDALQAQLDSWHTAHKGQPLELSRYHDFLDSIDYLVPESDAFSVTTENVDPEIATVAGPQLVVPADNARYALNAANARWGSLYDALYGTDVIVEDQGAEKGTSVQSGAWREGLRRGRETARSRGTPRRR